MVAQPKTVELSVNKITIPFYVRRTLKPKRVDYFTQLLSTGGEVEPIKVNPKGELIEGRHRLKAHQALHRRKITCQVVPVTDRSQMIVMAMAANSGGPMQMDEEDYVYSATQLLELNQRYQKVVKALVGMGLTLQYAKRLVSNARTNINKTHMRAAAIDVVDHDAPIAESAKKHRVNVNSLRSHLKGRTKSAAKSDRPAAVNSVLSRRFKTLSSSNARLMAGLFRGYEDGEVGEKTVQAALAKMTQLYERLGLVIKDYGDRFGKLAKPSRKK